MTGRCRPTEGVPAMATFLYRVGRFGYQHRLLVPGIWLVLLFAALGTTTMAKPFQSDFSMPRIAVAAGR